MVQPQLPLILLALMMAIGLGLEAVYYDGPQWWAKAPLAVLLLWSAVVVWRRDARGEG